MEKRYFKKRLLLSVLLIGITPILVVVLFVMRQTEALLVEQYFQQLEMIRVEKEKSLLTYINDSKSDLELLTDVLQGALTTTNSIPVPIDRLLKKMVSVQGYEDVFLMDEEGFIFYSAQKGQFIKENVELFTLQPQVFYLLYTRMEDQDTIIISDYFLDTVPNISPSLQQKAPRFLMSESIMDRSSLQLIVALQLSIDSITAIMTQREGLGATGEAYLVGKDNLMRSDSYLDPVHHSVFASFRHPNRGRVSTEATEKALAGERGAGIIIDYNGNEVLSSFAPISMEGISWGLLVEINKSEVLMAVRKSQRVLLIVTICSIILIIVAFFRIRKMIVACTGEHCLRGIEMEREILAITDRLNRFSEKFRRW